MHLSAATTFTSTSNPVVFIENLRFLDSYDPLIQFKMNFYQIYFLFVLYPAFLWPVTINNVSSCVFLCDLEKNTVAFYCFWLAQQNQCDCFQKCKSLLWCSVRLQKSSQTLCHLQLCCPAAHLISKCAPGQRYLFNRLSPRVTSDAE